MIPLDGRSSAYGHLLRSTHQSQNRSAVVSARDGRSVSGPLQCRAMSVGLAGRYHCQTPHNNVMHAKSGLRVVLKWKIYRPDSVITAVRRVNSHYLLSLQRVPRY